MQTSGTIQTMFGMLMIGNSQCNKKLTHGVVINLLKGLQSTEVIKLKVVGVAISSNNPSLQQLGDKRVALKKITKQVGEPQKYLMEMTGKNKILELELELVGVVEEAMIPQNNLKCHMVITLEVVEISEVEAEAVAEVEIQEVEEVLKIALDVGKKVISQKTALNLILEEEAEAQRLASNAMKKVIFQENAQIKMLLQVEEVAAEAVVEEIVQEVAMAASNVMSKVTLQESVQMVGAMIAEMIEAVSLIRDREGKMGVL